MGCVRVNYLLILLVAAGELEGRFWWDDDTYGYPKNYKLKDGATFDYVVVGAGAAGSAAAARLSLAGHSVLLVEAGGDPPAAVKVPAGVTSMIGTKYDWAYQTTSNNKSCLSSPCQFYRGKCLGGSTSINHMLYTRGNRVDYEYDLPGWTWNDIKPYLLRYEGLKSLDRLPESSKQFHNTSGLMKLSWMDDSKSPWHSKIIDAYRHLNFPQNDDVNGLSQVGVGIIPAYVHNGERMSTARAYLARSDVQRNLKVAKHTLCAGVIIENSTAIGVKLIQKDKIKHIYARIEIILCAGAIGTPQILMLSGIGPAEHLRDKRIPLQADLPVGDTMLEHIHPALFVQVDKSTGLFGDLASLARRAMDVSEYATDKKGPLSSIGLVDIGVFANTSCYNTKTKLLENGAGCDIPNLQIVHTYIDSYLFIIGEALLTNFSSPQIFSQLSAASEEYGIILISPITLTPYSQGKIRLANKDPFSYPIISPNFLDDERDLDQCLRAISIIEDLVETAAFKQNGAKIVKLRLGCPDYGKDREGYWKCYTRHLIGSGLHAVGTAALGTVLDERLRVRGVSRLRVADLSALPKIPKGSTEAIAIALGERVVDFVLEENRHDDF